MTVSLSDVKAKFCKYVSLVENGGVIEITKHGKAVAVIISPAEYKRLNAGYHPTFIDNLNRWRCETGGLTEDEYNSFEQNILRNKVYANDCSCDIILL